MGSLTNLSIIKAAIESLDNTTHSQNEKLVEIMGRLEAIEKDLEQLRATPLAS